jgi:hypothetical protein
MTIVPDATRRLTRDCSIGTGQLESSRQTERLLLARRLPFSSFLVSVMPLALVVVVVEGCQPRRGPVLLFPGSHHQRALQVVAIPIGGAC